MTTNVRKQKIITAIFWSVIAIMLLAMGIYAIRDLPMRLAMKVSPNIHLAIEMSTDNSTYKTVFKNYGNETLDSNINRTIEDGNKITLTGDIFNEIYSNEPLYIRITNYTQASDVEGDANYSSGPALNAYFSAENGVTNYPSYGVQNIAPYNGTTLYSKTFIVIPQSVIVDSNYQFNLKLELSNFVSTEYTVTQNFAEGVIGLNNFATTKAIFGHNFEANFMSTDNSKEIAITSITFGTTSLVEFGDYTFDSDTGKLTIFKDVFENNVGNPLATTNVLTINTALKPANVRVYVYDESQNATILKYGTKTFVDNNSFTIDTKSQFVAQILKTDSVTNLWVSINGEYSDNYFYNQATGLLTISQNALAGDVTINMFSYWTGNVASSFAGGNGSSANPYKICSPSQLAYLAQTTNAGTTYEELNFELKNDLYLNDELFTWNTSTGYVTASDGVNSVRIGTGSYNTSPVTTTGALESTYQGTLHQFTPIGTPTNKFYGNFTGNNFAINNSYYNDVTKGCVGLFGNISGAKIESVQVRNSFVLGISTVANLISQATNTTINNCRVINSYVSSKIDSYGEGNSASLCGWCMNSIIKNSSCYNVYVSSSGEYVGGGIALIRTSVVTNINVVNATIISSGANGFGGFVGLVYYETNYIKNCYASGITIFVSRGANSKLFGLVGECTHYVESCYHEGSGMYGNVGNGGAISATNCSQINGNTLVTQTYGTTVLKDALNNWLSTTNETDATKTNRQYFDIGSGTWQIVAGENDGYPIFV